MKILTPGHRYALKDMEGVGYSQELQFIEKVPTAPGSTTLKTRNNGTTNEELLAVLIDRMQFLDNAFPCKENKSTITYLKRALGQQEKRTADRKARKVEGKNEA